MVSKKIEAKALIVDDEPDLLELLEYHLSSEHGCELKLASCGAEALEICKQEKFDFILTDYKMPLVDGGEFIRITRHMEGLNTHTPIIMITAWRPQFEVDEKTWENVFFLEKPINFEKLDYYINCSFRVGQKINRAS